MDLKSYIPKYNGKVTNVFPNGNTQDIIKVMSKIHPFAVAELKDFAKKLTGTNAEKTQTIYNFLVDNVKLEHDPFGVQNVKKPSALVGIGKGDCKSFSLFIAGALTNLGIPFEYKFISKHATPVHHVYVVAYPDGKRTVMDVNLKQFNKEVTGIAHSKIYKPEEMTQINMIGAVNKPNPKYKKIVNLK